MAYRPVIAVSAGEKRQEEWQIIASGWYPPY
jgi:hypothetical protein